MFNFHHHYYFLKKRSQFSQQIYLRENLHSKKYFRLTFILIQVVQFMMNTLYLSIMIINIYFICLIINSTCKKYIGGLFIILDIIMIYNLSVSITYEIYVTLNKHNHQSDGKIYIYFFVINANINHVLDFCWWIEIPLKDKENKRQCEEIIFLINITIEIIYFC